MALVLLITGKIGKSMNKSLLFFFFFTLLKSVSAQVETTDFEKEFNAFQKKQNSEFDGFKDKINQEFALFLKQNWEQFNVEKPKEKPLNPKPDRPIKFTPSGQDTSSQLPKQKQTPEKAPIEITEPIKKAKPTIPVKENEFQVLFLNTLIPVEKAALLSVSCKGYNEESVSEYWSTVSKTDFNTFISSIKQNQITYSLNDWATYLLVKKIAEDFHNDKNSQVAFQFFCLSQLGYDVKVARINQDLSLLISFKQMVYGLEYLSINNKNYFIPVKTNNNGVYTFKNEFENAITSLNLEIKETPKINYTIKSRSLTFQNTNLSINYPKEIIDFYDNIPQTDFTVLFNSTIDIETEKSLVKAITPFIEGKSEKEAVGVLLSFVQNSFEYKTDKDQFGKEKYFFVEDILNFPYSDCEDRSVFFAYLVKRFLNLEVIGLYYPSHIATAVRFSDAQFGNTISYDNKIYTICDPTYIGAPMGECMPDYIGVSPKVIVVR